jgi:hypothetical protein
MQITPQPKLVRIAATVGVLALVGFAYGVTQTLRNPNDRPHLPLPAPQAAMMNLDGVPRATPLDAATSNALLDPNATRLGQDKSKEDDEDEEADAADAGDKPDAGPQPLATAPVQHEAPPAPSQPTPAQHGPF